MNTVLGRTPLLTAADVRAALMAGLANAQAADVDVCPNDYEFVLKYGLRVDGKLLTGDDGLDGDYKHLREVYEDTALEQVLMAGAQTGKTARMFVRALRSALNECWGQQMGLFFPNAELMRIFSTTRFRPFVRTNPTVSRLLGAEMIAGDGSRQEGRDATQSMTLGQTHLHFFTIGGKMATEGMPLKATFFDEVRGMNIADVQKAELRKQAQTLNDPVDFKCSTAKYPKGDIHHFYLEGTQHVFHTQCRCPDGIVLAERFPDCLLDLTGASTKLRRRAEKAFAGAKYPYLGLPEREWAKYQGTPAVYYCPTCDTILADPREGWWEARYPERTVHSYQIPALLSVQNPAPVVLHKLHRMVDRQEFHNSVLGMPWVDTAKQPLQHEHVDACINNDLQWGEELADKWRRRLTNCAMGIDVQAGYGVAVIKRMLTTGKARVVHVEVLRNQGERTWWHRAADLMHRYDVRTCVVDKAPEYTESMRFAHVFPGRVFLADFTLTDKSRSPILWPQPEAPDQRKGEPQNKHAVKLDRTRALQWALNLWKVRMNDLPPPRRLTQLLPLDREGNPVFSAYLQAGTDGLYPPALCLRDQLTRFVVRDLVEDASHRGMKGAEALRQGKRRVVMEWIDASPDLAFADLYCSVGLQRHGTGAFTTIESDFV